MTDTATPVWQAIPALAVFQFRWRFLSLLGISAAVLLGYLLDVSPPRWRRAFFFLVLSGVIGFQLPSLYPELLRRYITMPPNPAVADVQTFALRAGYPGLTTFNEFLPIWRTLPFPEKEVALVRASLLANLPEQGSIFSENRSICSLRLARPVTISPQFAKTTHLR